MDPGPGYPLAYIPPQQFQYHPSPFPFGVPSSAAPVPSPAVIAVPGFFNPWEPPPPPVPPPSDSDLQKRIDKLVEYAAKNGPQFEALMKDKQKENPAYSFLFGSDGHEYYRYRLWLTINPHLGAQQHPAALAPVNPNLASLNPALVSLNPGINAALSSVAVAPQAGGVFRPAAAGFYGQQQQSQPFFDQFQHEAYSQFNSQHVLPSGPAPPEVMMELKGVLDGLTGTKESIKGAKMWFMQRVAFGPALAEAMRDRVLALEGDVERQLYVIYLANDILFNSLQQRSIVSELDSEALAFRPFLGAMLAAVYHDHQDPDVNQERLQKILQFWGAKEVYDTDTINTLEGEMVAGPAPPPSESSVALLSTAAIGMGSLLPTGSAGSMTFQYPGQWQSDQSSATQSSNDQQQSQEQSQQSQASFAGLLPGPQSFFGSAAPFTAPGAPQFVAGSVPSMYPALQGPPFLAPLPAPVTQNSAPVLAQLPTLRTADQPPYPLFPPGLIPGMVRKMQIGSGVPYSPLSPLDIPTVIPPATNTESYILERVAKFFKDIAEVDPLEGQIKARDGTDNDGEEGEDREGGARIPPPAHMQVDPETGTLPDGSVEHRPGVGSTGRLGLGAAVDPNEVTQYDDVYTSYRKQRSTNYHTSLSARAAAAR